MTLLCDISADGSARGITRQRRMMAMVAAVGLSGMVLAGCVNTTASAPQGKISAPAVEVPATMNAVSATRAVSLFDSVCGTTVETDFRDAKAKMAANGVRPPAGTGTMYSATEDVSFQIQDGPGYGKTCSMVFGSTDSRATVVKSLSGLGKLAPSPMGSGLAALYRNKPYFLLFPAEAMRMGDRTYYHFKLLSDNGAG